MFGVFQHAARVISANGTPLKKAHEVPTALTSCAWTSELADDACGQHFDAARIAVTIHRVMVLCEAAWYGGVEVINRFVTLPRVSFVL